MGQMKRFPSVLRTRYLHALLAEWDPAKAAAIRARFETVAGTYPYPADIASERELMALGDARAARVFLPLCGKQGHAGNGGTG